MSRRATHVPSPRRLSLARSSRARICILLLLPPLVATALGAAVITVSGACSLRQAIDAANTDAVVGSCSAGSGPDTLVLTAAVTLASIADTTDGDNGLPSITSDITIDGNQFWTYLVKRSATAPDFRIFHVAPAGKLTLKNLRLSKGRATSISSTDGRSGGGILNRGTLVMKGTWTLGNHAGVSGGGIFNTGDLDMTGGFIENNTALFGGGVWNESSLTQTRIHYTDNEANSGGGLYSGFGGTLAGCGLHSNEAAVDGGGIWSSGVLKLTDTSLTENTAENRGGGIYADSGTLTFTRGTTSGNSADLGGGVFLRDCHATLTEVTLAGNGADSQGGGALNDEVLELIACTLSGNTAGNGAGVWNDGSLKVSKSTFKSNTATSFGGGIRNQSFLEVRNSTFSGNAGATGGGIYSNGPAQLRHVTLRGNTASGNGGALFVDNPVMNLRNSLLAASTPQNCGLGPGAAITDADSSNQADDSSCGTIAATLIGLDSTLADHGGPTETHALLVGSSAIDAGECEALQDEAFAADQRSAPRVGTCDAGAYEYLGCPTLLLADRTFTTPNEEFEECQILAGPDLVVSGPSGDLLLRGGLRVALDNGVMVESGGELVVEIDPALELRFPDLIAADRKRRSEQR